ncbi:MAG: hypothetical protein WC496_11640 [Phycisphaerae bacterium]|jgi:hypothetical protein
MLTGFGTSGFGVTAPTFSFNAAGPGRIDGLGRLKSAFETLTKPDNSTIEHSLSFGYDSL